MHLSFSRLAALILTFLLASCAAPPSSDPSKVESTCAQQCSANLTTCSSGFKLFPVVAQQQCNDTYDVCIKGCPARVTTAAPQGNTPTQSTSERLKALDELLRSGAITKQEYEAKRKEILSTL